MALPTAPVQAEAELDALRSELQQQQADLARRAASLAAAAKEGAAQVGCPLNAAGGLADLRCRSHIHEIIC
jgi:multidrug resistance efflux pump